MKNPKFIMIALFSTVIAVMFYDGIEGILDPIIGSISPSIKVITALLLALLGYWKLG